VQGRVSVMFTHNTSVLHEKVISIQEELQVFAKTICNNLIFFFTYQFHFTVDTKSTKFISESDDRLVMGSGIVFQKISIA
jgi:hypothetical protein